MYRFRIYLQFTTLSSSRFDDFEECEEVFDNLQYDLKKAYNNVGGSIEEYIEGIGWVTHE